MNILITGRPGCGKSRLLQEIVKELNLKVGGIVTPEIRKRGERIGFEIVDIATGKRQLMAGIGIKGPKVSKYGVNISAIEFGIKAIERAIKEAELIVIDEIGKMELCHPDFDAAVRKAFLCGKPVLACVQLKLIDN
ncbi:MAG: nucleoside-triphosphatase, partial [Candidatus Aenigmatarchaeota archaeon]